MKHFNLLSLIFVASISLSHFILTERVSFYSSSSQTLSQTQLQFHKFIEDFNKQYTTLQEYLHRLQIFEENLKKFEAHNANPNSTYTMGITPFADVRPEEAYEKLGMEKIDLKNLKGSSLKEYSYKPEKYNYIMSIDWSVLGVVPDVVDTQDSKEGTNYMITYAIDSSKSLQDETFLKDKYSVQELIDCTSNLQAALEFTVSKGLETEENYKSQSGCAYDPRKLALHLKEWDILRNQGDIVQHMELNLQVKPIVTLINAESGNFLYYTGGIIDSGCPTQVVINHALLLVGYNANENYWKLQNSWGMKWGEYGYVRVKRGENICGIESFVLTPELY